MVLKLVNDIQHSGVGAGVHSPPHAGPTPARSRNGSSYLASTWNTMLEGAVSTPAVGHRVSWP